MSTFDHGGTQTVRFWGLQHGVWRLMLLLLAAAKQVGLRCSQGFARSTGDVRQPGRLVSGGYPGRRLVCSRASSMYWFKVSFLWGVVGFWSWWHANSPLLGATICPLGVWRLMLLLLAAAKQVGLRCSQGFARSTGDVRQPGRLVSGGYPGRRLVCSRASSMYWFKVSFLWGVVGFWSWWHANSPLLGATICPLGVWRLMLLLLAAAKQVGLRCSQGFARSTGDVRQPGRLVSGGYPGRRLVCSRASSMYWFKVSFLRWGPEGLGKLLMLSAKEKGKHLRKLEYI